MKYFLLVMALIPMNLYANNSNYYWGVAYQNTIHDLENTSTTPNTFSLSIARMLSPKVDVELKLATDLSSGNSFEETTSFDSTANLFTRVEEEFNTSIKREIQLLTKYHFKNYTLGTSRPFVLLGISDQRIDLTTDVEVSISNVSLGSSSNTESFSSSGLIIGLGYEWILQNSFKINIEYVDVLHDDDFSANNFLLGFKFKL